MIFCEGVGYSQGLPDSLEVIINSREGRERISLINQLASKYAESDIILSQHLAQQALNLAENINDRKGKSEAANTLGVTYYFLGRNNQAEYYCSLAQGLAKSIYSPDLERKANTTLALVFLEVGAYDKCLDIYNRNLVIDQGLNDIISLGMDYQNIGRVYELKGELGTSVQNYSEAASIFEAGKDNERLVKVYSSLGKLYLQVDLDSARSYLDKSFSLYSGSSRLDEFYDIYWNSSRLYRALGRPDSAIHILSLALRKAEDTENRMMLINAYEELSLIYSAIGDYRNAFQYQTLKENLNDSIADQSADPEYTSKLSMLENENRDQAVELLKKEARINENKWVSRNVLYFLVVGGIFLMIFVTFAFYSRYRLFKSSISSAEKLKQDIVGLSAEISSRDRSMKDLKEENDRHKQRIHFLNTVLESIIAKQDQPGDILISDLDNIANMLNADRAGLLRSEGYNRLVSLGEYDKNEKKLHSGVDMVKEEYPLFFELMRGNETVVTDNCTNDPRYAEFTGKRFLYPVKTARIDQPLIIENKLFGVLFIEKTDEGFKWNESHAKLINEMSERFLPVLAKAPREKVSSDIEGFSGLKTIAALLDRLELILLDKDPGGMISRIFPNEITAADFICRIETKSNWLSVIDKSDHGRLIAFYNSVINEPGRHALVKYNIYDQSGNRLSVVEEVLQTYLADQENRILSIVYLKERDSGDERVLLNSFRAIIASISHGLLVCDHSGNIILVNPALEKISGYQSGDLVSREISVLFYEGFMEAARKGNLDKIKNADLKTKSGTALRCGVLSRSFYLTKTRYFVFEIYFNRTAV
jgi:tetratricopeptide (TPR) repeat protein